MSYRKSKKKFADNFSFKKHRKIKRKRPHLDYQLLMIILFLLLFGTIAVFSAGAPQGVDAYDDPLYYPKHHLIFLVLGGILMVIASKIHYKKWKQYVMPVSLIIGGLIAATMLPGVGKTSLGATRWINVMGMQIQPSEFGKFACVLLTAVGLENAKSLFDQKLWSYLIGVAAIMLIILLQPNLSICIILCLTCLAMTLAGGMNFKLIFLALAALIPAAAIWITKNAYQLKRITGWLDPFSDPQGKGYNIIQSWYAISSGGFVGSGIGNSKQKLYYLPFGHTDFIFSVIAEELGLIGTTGLIILFLLLINRGFKIACRCEDRFGKLLAFGIIFIIGIQAFINMCVATGLFPVTGVTLPLISYGGSSLLTTMGMLGVLLNISRYKAPKKKELEVEQSK